MSIIRECIETGRGLDSEEEFYAGKYCPGTGLLFDCDCYLSKEVVELIPMETRRLTECSLDEAGVDIYTTRVSGRSRRLCEAHKFLFSISEEDGKKYLPNLIKFFLDC